MKIDKKLVSDLEDDIHKRGAMKKLISDSEHAEGSNRTNNMLRPLFSEYWQIEANY